MIGFCPDLLLLLLKLLPLKRTEECFWRQILFLLSKLISVFWFFGCFVEKICDNFWAGFNERLSKRQQVGAREKERKEEGGDDFDSEKLLESSRTDQLWLIQKMFFAETRKMRKSAKPRRSRIRWERILSECDRYDWDRERGRGRYFTKIERERDGVWGSEMDRSSGCGGSVGGKWNRDSRLLSPLAFILSGIYSLQLTFSLSKFRQIVKSWL